MLEGALATARQGVPTETGGHVRAARRMPTSTTPQLRRECVDIVIVGGEGRCHRGARARRRQARETERFHSHCRSSLYTRTTAPSADHQVQSASAFPRGPRPYRLGCPVYPVLGARHAAKRVTAQIRWRHPGWPSASPYRHPASLALQASFNEQIKHIIRKLHAVFVQPQQQQDKSLGGNVEHEMIFARPIDNIPDFDRLVARSGHNLGPIRGKRDRVDAVAVGVGLLAQQLQFACQTSQQESVLAEEGRLEGSAAHQNPRL